MKKFLKLLLHKIPFVVRFYIKKNILNRIDEVEIVYEVLKKEKGVMLDVGAHYGESLESFMNDNWVVHAFEPDPKNRVKLLNRINGKSNVIITTDAVTNKSGLELAFFTSNVSTGISSLSNFHPTHKETNKVKTITLKDYINTNGINKIDFLKIDTEGHDLFVLEGFDWKNHSHPKVIICEFEDKKTLPLGYSTTDMYNYLKEKEYEVIISEWYPIVEYGLAHKWKSFDGQLSNLDQNWGNLIAIKKDIVPYFQKYCSKS